MMARTVLFLTLFACFSAACNSSNSGEVTIDIDPAGKWKVTFTELVDECDVIAPDDEGVFFESEELITKDGDTYSVSAPELVFGTIDGGLRSEQSLIASGDLSGDIFATGFDCTISERLAYNDLTESSANVVYEVTIDCDDGSRCDSLFRAQGERLE